MARKAKPIECGAEDRQFLERLSRSRTESRQVVERARMVLGCVRGVAVQQTARECRTRPNIESICRLTSGHRTGSYGCYRT